MTFGRAGAGVEVGDLEGGRLEMLGPLIPLATGEFRQRRRERVHRVLRELRVGDVPLHAVHGEAPAEGAATTHLDGVADRGLARGSPTTHQSRRSPRSRSTCATRRVPSTDGPSSSLVIRNAIDPL